MAVVRRDHTTVPRHRGDKMNEKTAELRNVCEEIFKDMRKFDAEHREESWGFHFGYSTKDSWRADTRVLFLTLNPQARNMKTNKNKLKIPDSPWEKKNAFLDPDNPFGIKMDALLIFAEIARHMADKTIKVEYEDKKLREFVDTQMVLASYVPFRTNAKPVAKSPMWDFAKTCYWNKILKIWQPELIIAVGSDPFSGIKALYSEMGWEVRDTPPEPISDYHPNGYESRGNFRSCLCSDASSGKQTLLLGVPHPAYKKRCGKNCGYVDPEHPDLLPPEQAPVQFFLRKRLAKAFLWQ